MAKKTRTALKKAQQKARTENNRAKPVKVKKFRTVEERLAKKAINKKLKKQ